MLATGESVDIEVVTMSQMPNPIISHYLSMYAYGNHFRVDDENGRSHVSFNSGVACIVNQTCRSSRADRNLIEAALKYIGIVKDIFFVEYGHINYNVIMCSWVRPNLGGAQTIRHDHHGFWSVGYDARQVPPVEPYLMPSHAKQV